MEGLIGNMGVVLKGFVRFVVLTATLLVGAWARAQPADDGTSPIPILTPTPPADDLTMQREPLTEPLLQQSIAKSPFSYGPVVFSPSASYSLMFASGIQSAPGHSSDVSIQTDTVTLNLSDAPIWSLEYTPSWVEYSSKAFHSGFNHAARIAADFSQGSWGLSASQVFNRSESPLTETARQTLQTSYGTEIRGWYGAGAGQPAIEDVIDQEIRYAQFSPSWYDWSDQVWIHLAQRAGWDISMGPGAGYDIVVPGFDMDYVRAQLRVLWQVSQRLLLQAQGGGEDRKFLISDGETHGTGIFSASAIYSPWDPTKITISGGREVTPSYLPNQVTLETYGTLSVQQRLLTHFFLTVSDTQSRSGYLSTSDALATVRSDRLESDQASLSTVIFKHLTVTFLGTRQKNGSSAAGFTYSTYQAGIQLSWHY